MEILKFTYSELSTFIESIVDQASEEGFPVYSISDLQEYLEENLDTSIEIIKHNDL